MALFELSHSEGKIRVYNPQVTASSFESLGLDTSMFEGKANSFTWRRGVEPSSGEFLVRSDEIPQPGTELTLEITCRSDPDAQTDAPQIWRFEGLEITKAINLIPGKDPYANNLYLIEVIDTVVSEWLYKRLEKNYNIVLGLKPKEDETDENEEVSYLYDKTSLDDEQASQSSEEEGDPWTWTKFFGDIIPNLNVMDFNFPQGHDGPEGVYSKDRTIAETLGNILTYLGATIVRGEQKTNLKLEPLKPIDTGNKSVWSKNEQWVWKSDYRRDHRFGTPLPEKVLLAFPKIELEHDLDEPYHIEELNPAAPINPPTIQDAVWRVEAPLYAQEPLQDAVTDAKTDIELQYQEIFIASQETENLTYEGFIYAQANEQYTEVTFFEHGYGEVGTYTTTSPERPLLYKEKTPRRTLIAHAKVVEVHPPTEESGGVERYDVANINLISGKLTGIEKGSDRLEKLEPLFEGDTFTEQDNVIVFYDQSRGKHFLFTGGSTPTYTVAVTGIQQAIWNNQTKDYYHGSASCFRVISAGDESDPEKMTIESGVLNVTTDLTSSFDIPAGKARFGRVVGNALISLDCAEVEFDEPA